MRKTFLILICLCCYIVLPAQKPAITPEHIDAWPQISNEEISNDGKIVIYRINKVPLFDTLVIHSITHRWIEKIPNARMAAITADSRLVVYRVKSKLFLYDVQKRKTVRTVDSLLSYTLAPPGNGQWLAWLQESQRLTVYNCSNGQLHSYENVIYYRLVENALLLELQLIENKQLLHPLQLIDLTTAKTFNVLPHARNLRSISFDAAGEQLAFMTDEKIDTQSIPVVRYYVKGMDSAIIRIQPTTPGIDSGYTLSNGGLWFSPNGRRLFFSLRKKIPPVVKAIDKADVTIWHYNDNDLPTERAANQSFAGSRNYTGVMEKGAGKVLQIDSEGDQRFIDYAGDGDHDYAIIRSSDNPFAGNWKEGTEPSYYLKNIATGERRLLRTQRGLTIYLSPAGKFVVWYDPQKKSWFSHAVTDTVVREITPVPGVFLPRKQGGRLNSFIPYGLAGWLPGDRAVLLYDEYDIWRCDPSGEKAPVNITNGYGRKHHLMLRIWNESGIDYETPVFKSSQQVLVAFDTDSKSNGFFRVNIARSADPNKLSLDTCLYYAHLQFNLAAMQRFPMLKAKTANAWIMRRMTASEYPNLWYSTSLSSFTRLSNVQPQRAVNWLTAETISWNKPDGTTGKGILYKPENLDPSKKYAVIFYFYESLSHRLHQFLQPEISYGTINIPWFVSRGYLVCTPDISYKTGYPGESALECVGSAAGYLASLPFVDSTKLGLQGHSFGGYQVNYIISHSNRFAAAQESAGASDFVSYYNGTYREHSAQFYFETGQAGIGHTLWQQPELFLLNSPVLKADQVQTPLLIMHNKGDEEVPFQQGLEWFTALRRLGKKAWMLQYDREYHSINQRKNQLDFTMRMTEFFDHYLKDAPPPKWLIPGGIQ